MGSDETAITILGGPRVIDVFYGNGAPSGPNYLLFSDVDRLSDSLRDRSEVGWSPRPHAPGLGAQLTNSLSTAAQFTMNYLAMGSRALGLSRRWRMRCRRLPTTRPTSIDLQEPICIRKK